MNFRSMACLFVSMALATALFPVRADDKTSPKGSASAAERFAALKKLVGEWVEIGKDGKPTEKVFTSFRATAAGTTLLETVFPGGDDEMITMYHLDGDDLILTHYCTFGNQPRMRAEPGSDVNRIAFKFVSATNLKSDNAPHMDHATFTLVDADRFTTEWVGLENGKPCHQMTVDLVRKPK
jgi:hypothetical protein